MSCGFLFTIFELTIRLGRGYLFPGRWRFSESEYDALNRVTASAEASVPDDDGTWATALADYTAARGMWGPYARTSTTTYDGRGFVKTQTGPEFVFDGLTSYEIDTVQRASAPYYFQVSDNLSAFTRATRAWVTGFASNNGIYTILGITDQGGGNWRITVAEQPPSATADGDIAVLMPDWEYTYDDDGRRTAAMNANNVSQATAYDADGRVLAQYAPGADASDPNVMPLQASRYDGQGRLIESTDATGNTTGYTYDLASRQDTVTDPKGNTSRVVYDAAGRVLQQIDPLGNVTTFRRDPVGRPLAIIDPLGHASSFTYDKLGRRLTSTTPRGFVTKWTYDALGRIVTETGPNGGVTTFGYDALSRRVTVSDAYNAVTTTAYDALGRTLSVTDPVGNETTYAYADFDEPTTLTLADDSEFVTTYNKRGLKLHMDLPAGDERDYTYDVLARLIEELNVTDDATTYAYDDLNRLISTVYPNELTITNGYDPAGRLTRRTKFHDDTIDPAESESWTYDVNGNQISHTDADGFVWTQQYDALNRLVARLNPLTTGAESQAFVFGYDAAGRLVQRTDPKGQLITQAYNDDNQLVAIYYPDGSKVEYNWTCCRLNWMSDAFGESRFVYDLGNRITLAADSRGHTVRYKYDANGRVLQMVLPGTGTVAYEYSPLSLISKITDADTDVTDFLYGTEKAGQLAGIDLGNGADIDYTWNNNGVLATGAIAQTAGGTVTETYTPADTDWPVASPLKASVTWSGTAYNTSALAVRADMRVLQEAYTAAAVLQFAQFYTTSPAGNLIAVSDTVVNPGEITDSTYFLDAASFLRGKQTAAYTLDPSNLQAIDLATNPKNITTDRNGNIIRAFLPSTSSNAEDRWDYTYDYENRLTKVEWWDADNSELHTWQFGYDGLGRRVWTQIDEAEAERYIYDGERLVQARSYKDDTLHMEYTYGPTAIGPHSIYKQHDGTTKSWFYTSPQFHFPRFKLNNSGVITKIYQYTSKGHYVAGFSPVADAPAFGWMGKWVFGLDTPFPLLTGSAFWSPNLGKSMDQLHGVSLLGGGTCPTGTCGGSLQEQRYEGGGDSFGQTPDPVDVGGKPSSTMTRHDQSGGLYYERIVDGLKYWNLSIPYAATCRLTDRAGGTLGAGGAFGGLLGGAFGGRPGNKPIPLQWASPNAALTNDLRSLALHLGEFATCLCVCTVEQCLVVVNIALQVEDEARLMTNQTTCNGPCGALRHCLLSCHLHTSFLTGTAALVGTLIRTGWPCADLMLNAHELIWGGQPQDRANDAHNNEAGRLCARDPGYTGCRGCCLARWQSKRLRW